MNTHASVIPFSQSKPAPNGERLPLKPLPLWQALLYFGLPALGFRLALYTGLPLLLSWGLNRFDAAVVSMTVPCAILFSLAFGVYKHEGHSLTWQGIQARFRLLPMGRSDWLWTALGFILAFLLTGALGGTSLVLIRLFPAITPPDSFPAFLNPLVTSNPERLPAALAEGSRRAAEGQLGRGGGAVHPAFLQHLR